MRVTRNQTIKLNLKPESFVFSEAPRVSSKSSKQVVVSSLAYECDPPINKKNDDYKVLVDFMNKRKGRKISRMIINKSRKDYKIRSPLQIEDEDLVRNQEVSSPRHNFLQEPVEKVTEEIKKEKTKINPNLEVSF